MIVVLGNVFAFSLYIPTSRQSLNLQGVEEEAEAQHGIDYNLPDQVIGILEILVVDVLLLYLGPSAVVGCPALQLGLAMELHSQVTSHAQVTSRRLFATGRPNPMPR